MEKTEHTDQDFELLWNFHQVNNIITKARADELSKYGVTISQAAILFLLYCIKKEASPAELSRMMIRKSNTMKSILDVMENRGLITKRKDTAKKNIVRVSLTKLGENTYRKCSNREFIHYLLSEISDEERQTLSQYLEKLRNRTLMWYSEKHVHFPPLLFDIKSNTTERSR